MNLQGTKRIALVMLCLTLGSTLLAAQSTSNGAPAVISSDAIEAALRKPAAAPAAAEPMKTRGLRLQARAEESRASDGGAGAGAPTGSVNLQIAFALDSATL